MEYLIQGDTMAALADAIREKNGETGSYTPAQMAAAIRRIVPAPEEPYVLYETDENGAPIARLYNFVSIPEYLFSYEKIKTVDFSGSPNLAGIGEGTFYRCSRLTSMTIPKSVMSVGQGAFGYCGALTAINFPTAPGISDFAFQWCSALAAVDFPAAVSIGTGAFQNCEKLAVLNFPVATSIEQYAFSDCLALTTADFPAASEIKRRAFGGCTGLTALILRNMDTVCACGDTILANTPMQPDNGNPTGFIYVPAALVDSYKAANGWKEYANRFRAIEDYPEICGSTA